MQRNASIPDATIIPELGYADVSAAAAWLCDAFGFSERFRIGDHRVQLTLGPHAAMVAREIQGAAAPSATRHDHAAPPSERDHSILVRVADVDAHCAWARQRGAEILNPPQTYPFGERQYSVMDVGGHAWTFSQTVADVAPEAWGGVRGANAEPELPDDTEDADWTFEL